MTAYDAATFLESLPPVTIKLRLVELLEWQAAKGKAVVHLNWYLRKLREPQMKPGQRTRMADLTAGIGKP